MADISDDPLSALRGLIKAGLLELNTSLPGEIVSYSGGLASVRPLATKRFPDGDTLDFPIIHAVPVRWPVFNGGKAGIKGPVVAGDKCLLIFAQQSIDDDDLRNHDLSDAYAVMVDNSQTSQGSNNSDMVIYHGASYIRLGESGDVEIVAPSSLKFTTPQTTNTGKFTVQGLFTFLAGLLGSGGTGGTSASITGNVSITGALTNNGKNIGSTHTHSGVQSGSGTTGTPV